MMLLFPAKTIPELLVLPRFQIQRSAGSVSDYTAISQPFTHVATARKHSETRKTIPVIFAMLLKIQPRMLLIRTSNHQFNWKRSQRTRLLTISRHGLEKDYTRQNRQEVIVMQFGLTPVNLVTEWWPPVALITVKRPP
eukprot:GHVU01068673.1.p3 GENE.GHVU01068673.1~~GHVU01068673.1.p3  ORF type:complete len:138 (-),score=12.82 GHVU01068673.1:1302-1715(-)